MRALLTRLSQRSMQAPLPATACAYRRPGPHWAALLLLAAWLCLPGAQARAAELHWANRPFAIVADNKPIADFVRELAASQNITAVVDDHVSGTISGRFSGTPRQTLNTICATYGLTWYYDGSVLYVARAADSETQVMPIPPGTAGELAQTLQMMNIADKRFPLMISDRANTVYASGPRRYVELVRQAISTVADPGRNGDRAEIRAFPLKYAWAANFTVNRSGKQVEIPGVASILRHLYGQRDGHALQNNSTASGAARQVKLSSGETLMVPRISLPGLGGDANGDSSNGGMPTNPGPALPEFEADPAINAVLIRDLPERLSQYATLITQLDKRPRIVEINLTIMDISLNSLDSLGIDWRLHTPHGDLQFGDASNPPLTFAVGSTEAGQTGTSTPAGLALTASIGGSLRNYLLTRVNALAQSGNAELHSKPKILALDNTEAVLENLTQFYIPVSGFQDSSLYSVTSGTSIRVTPMIVDDPGHESVMMSLDIQDGEVSTQSVQNIPAILERNIITRSMVDEGKSLLIAGFNSDEKSFTKTGIPLLSDIPFIGNLFKYTSKNGQHMERFYLLTPRIVTAMTDTEADGTPIEPNTAQPDAALRPPSNDSLAPATTPATTYPSSTASSLSAAPPAAPSPVTPHPALRPAPPSGNFSTPDYERTGP